MSEIRNSGTTVVPIGGVGEFGANATVVCGVTIGRYAFIAAGAVVAKDVPDYALMVGCPARQKGKKCVQRELRVSFEN